MITSFSGFQPLSAPVPGVKGRCPLRVQGRARKPLPKAIPADRRKHPHNKQVARLAPTTAKGGRSPTSTTEPNQAKRKFCAEPGQGTMSLAGAGRSPQILAGRQFHRRRKPTPREASRIACALPPSDGHTPEGATEPNPAKRKFCAEPGQGTMSLAGAGRSPQILADRQFRRRRKPTPREASRMACALPPSGGHTPTALLSSVNKP